MLRKLLIAIGAIVVLLVVAIILVVVLVNPDDYREQIATQASEQLGRPVALNGPMDLKVFPSIALELNDVEVGNPQGFPTDVPLTRVGSALASVQLLPLLRGAVSVGDIHLQDVTLNVLTDSSGRTNLEGLGSSGTEPVASSPAEAADLSQIRTGGIRFERLQLNLTDLAARQTQSVLIDTVEIDAFSAGEDLDFNISGSITSNGEDLIRGLDVRGTVNIAPDLSRIGLPQLSVQARLPAAQADVEVNARGEISRMQPLHLSLTTLAANVAMDDGTEVAVDSPLDMHINDITELDLTKLQARYRAPSGDLDVDFAGAVNARLADVASFQLGQSELMINGQVLQTEGQVSLGNRPSLNLSVRGETLDLTQLIANATGEATGTGASDTPPAAGSDAEGGVDQAAEADFSALHPWRMDMELNLQQLLLPNLALSEVVGVLKARDGVITLDPLSARLFQGTFNGVATVDTRQNPPAVHLQPRLEGIAVQSLLELVSPKSPARGDGAMSLDIRFQGLDPQQIASSLDGAGEFKVLDGAIVGVDLNRLLNEELNTSDLSNVREAIGGETIFESLSGEFTAKSGVLELPNINMDTLQFGMNGTGRMDLTQQTLDYNMTLKLGEQLSAQMPSRLMSVTGGNIPLKLSGPLTAPIVTVDVESMLQNAVKKQVEKRGKNLLNQLFKRDDDEEASEDDSDGNR